MKRYNHEYFGPGDDVGGNMNEAEDGDWVRYEDHAADRAALVQDRDDWQQVSRDWRYRAEQAEIKARELRADRAALVAQLAELTRERDEAAHAAQPATAPTVPQCRNRQPSDGGHSLAYRDGGYCDWCGAKAAQPATAPTRTEAEQRVLDAMGEIPDSTLAIWAAGPCDPGWLGSAAKAELARRGLK